jgi:hypothetical protein
MKFLLSSTICQIWPLASVRRDFGPQPSKRPGMLLSIASISVLAFFCSRPNWACGAAAGAAFAAGAPSGSAS